MIIRTNLKSDNITPSRFNTILKLVLYKKIFEFNKTYYIQTNGVAMSCKCGANLYLYILEKLWLFLVNLKKIFLQIYVLYIRCNKL